MGLFRFFENRLEVYPEDNYNLPTDNFLKFLWACTKGLRGWIFAFMFLTGLIGVYESLLYKWIGDIVNWLGAYTPANLWSEKGNSLLMMAAVLVVSPILVGLSSLIHFQTLQGVFPMQMRWRFHRQMLGQSMQFYQDEFSGRVSAKVMQTALAVRDTIMTIADMLVYVLVYFVSSGIILFHLDGWLLIPFLLWMVMFFATVAYFIPKLKNSASRQADARALMTGRITDAYANITTVKLFSHSRRELTYAKDAMSQFLGTVHDQMRWVSRLELVNHLINVVLVGTTVALGLYLWYYNGLSVGAIAAATAMAMRLNGLTHWIMWQTAALFENIGTVQDGMKTLSKPHTVVDKPNARDLLITQGEISFSHVDFNYGRSGNKTNDADAKQKLLDDFNLEIKAGEKIGLVGRSGAGKSTLVNLLLRFYDVDGGAILIDNQNISDVTQESLRQQIGMVTQDTSLLHRTVRENIAYGRPDATDEQIISAAKQAHAWEFIQHLSDAKGNVGLDTQVGERGVKLSGGQRQRIAIARALLRNSPIVILDEATTGLDPASTSAVLEAIDELVAGRTTLTVTHDPQAAMRADRVVWIQDGRIRLEGSPQDLMESSAEFRRWANSHLAESFALVGSGS